MAYSAFGYSLPQLSVTGYAAPVAAYGGPLSIDVRVENIGASSEVEPTHLAPGSVTDADSGPTTVEIYASPRSSGTAKQVLIDTVSIPSIVQNSQYESVETIALPSRPSGFPGNGGKLYLTFVVDNDQSVLQSSNAGNIYRDPTPVAITDPLPDLQVVGFDVPSQLEPGDVIAPTIRIANLGAGNPASQGPVLVQLIASLDTTYGPGDAVVGQYAITSLPGISGVPTQGSIANDANVIITPNENDFTFGPIKLPSTPGFYHLGVKIDPYHAINQTYGPNSSLSDLINVGPADAFSTPSTQVATSAGLPVFPNLPSSLLTIIPVTTTTGTTTGTTTSIFPTNTTGPTLGPVPRTFAASGYPVVAQAKNGKGQVVTELVHLATTPAKVHHAAKPAAHKSAHKA